MIASTVNSGRAIDRVATELGIQVAGGGTDHPPDPIIAEYLRSAIGALSRPKSADGGPEPVYISRLTHLVKRQLAPLWPELASKRTRTPSQTEMESEGDNQPDPIRFVLDGLNDLREVCNLGKGYWLPCPVRLVKLPDAGTLVVGGCNRVHLQEVLRTEVGCNWIARVLKDARVPSHLLSSPGDWQPFEAWLGDDPHHQNLAEWTQGFLDRAKCDLGASGSEVGALEVYAPWLRSKNPQYFRWVRVEELTKPKEIVLCRRGGGRWGPRVYLFGSIGLKNGKPVLERESEIEQGLVRRLQYGLDALANAPTRVSVVRSSGELKVTLKSWLPPEERRLFFALTKEVSTTKGRLPQTFLVSESYANSILGRLERLRIAIDRLV